MFSFGAKSKKEISETLEELGSKEEIMSSSLWIKSTKGINFWSLLKTIFSFGFAGAILYVVVKEWIELDEERILMTVFGAMFFVVLMFLGIVCGSGVKKRPDDLLDYVVLHEIHFQELSRDFATAVSFGKQIYKGENYVFVINGKGMQIAAIKDITNCDVMRMGGWSVRRLFLAYYILSISTEENCIMKYGMNPVNFYKLKTAITKTNEGSEDLY